ncbi:ATP synthase F1 subunit epsilon [Parapedobacter sp. ISTM3]|uniref:F-type H+-transporting ATPase subunit epsilon n=1 Tax=Parapedobacter luteus TaxID=623280 RepID=A0A1T5A2D4_9SPHI|nr:MULTISPECIES: ATP synthase F1 subunit epsilon [Parapedobacter]MBK1440092.1 ATP synthase F1 subunit epsilon [Parapedobacter sp. ISTM3]SKB29184.1 F-type H+-transporting ATPase subunit epsilon [Parapedobacter luteus]
MKLTIITPDKPVFEGEVTSVTVPGTAGSFEVLENHAPIVSTLEDGKVIIRTGKSEEIINIIGGVVEVIHNNVTVLAEGITTT